MIEELEQRIDEGKLEKLIGRIREAYDNGVLRVRDWMAMYDLLIDACEREKAAAMEQYIVEVINEESDEQ